MCKKELMIAVASTDGKVVNQHFGRADSFIILNRSEETGELTYLETRHVPPVCHSRDHDDAALRRNAETLSGCDFLLVSKIGQPALRQLEALGVRVFELPGVIEESVEKMWKYLQVEQGGL